MVAAVLKCFFAGNAFELQREIIASYIGMEYKERKKRRYFRMCQTGADSEIPG